MPWTNLISFGGIENLNRSQIFFLETVMSKETLYVLKAQDTHYNNRCKLAIFFQSFKELNLLKQLDVQ
jgi:hypothetical protein